MEQELEEISAIYQMVTEYLVNYSFQILAAIVIFIIGLVVSRKVADWVLGFLVNRNVDATLSRFTASTLRLLILTMVMIIALGKLGISVTPFVAAIGAASLGVGLALQGVLSNYGAGVTIIVVRPFVEGDTISVQNVTGIVQEIKLGYTILTDEDGVKITIPNRHIVGEIIHNSHADRILELTVRVAYQTDPELAINCIQDALQGVEGISDERYPLVGIHAFGEHSIDIGIRAWAKTQSLFQTRYRVNLAVHKALQEQGIVIPFPQREVRLLGEPAGANRAEPSS